jgi:hypothetical protein
VDNRNKAIACLTECFIEGLMVNPLMKPSICFSWLEDWGRNLMPQRMSGKVLLFHSESRVFSEFMMMMN